MPTIFRTRGSRVRSFVTRPATAIAAGAAGLSLAGAALVAGGAGQTASPQAADPTQEKQRESFFDVYVGLPVDPTPTPVRPIGGDPGTKQPWQPWDLPFELGGGGRNDPDPGPGGGPQRVGTIRCWPDETRSFRFGPYLTNADGAPSSSNSAVATGQLTDDGGGLDATDTFTITCKKKGEADVDFPLKVWVLDHMGGNAGQTRPDQIGGWAPITLRVHVIVEPCNHPDDDEPLDPPPGPGVPGKDPPEPPTGGPSEPGVLPVLPTVPGLPPSNPPSPGAPQPSPTKPMPTEPNKPVAAQPTKPVPTQPTKPAPTEPTKPVSTQPTKPVPTQPTGHLPNGQDTSQAGGGGSVKH